MANSVQACCRSVPLILSNDDSAPGPFPCDSLDKDLSSVYSSAVSSNSTSAIIEALSCGRKTFLFIDKSNFDLSPIKNTKIEKKVDFFYTKKDLVYKIKNCKHNFEPIEYYYLDKELKKWKKF